MTIGKILYLKHNKEDSMSSENETVEIESKPAVPFFQRNWVKTTWKVMKETSKYVVGAAAGVAVTAIYLNKAE